MAKIVLQNQSSPTTPECGFTAMYVNSETGLPTFKRDDGTECAFLLACENSNGLMDTGIYDPNDKCADVFNMDNMTQGCTNKFVAQEQINCWNCKLNACDLPDLSNYAKCCDVPTDNCQLANSCGYTTCTGTLVPSDIENLAQCCDVPSISGLAQCCDIPTDNCQLANSCGYITNSVKNLRNYYLKCETYTKAEVDCAISNFGGFCVVEDLPESGSTNVIYLKGPIGSGEDKYEEWIYSTYWTLIGETSTDLSNYAKCCDVPTDNCQLINGCGYTTCTGTLVESDLQPYTKTCDLCTVATSGKYCDLTGTPNIPTDNCQLSNSCGYITNSALSGLAQCCDIPSITNLAQCRDIPTNNCQLTNGCGYLCVCDLTGYAQTCEIPTDNCQLLNSCGYTKCKGNMLKCLYDPNNCATNVYNMDNMFDGMTKVAMTTAERTKLSGISGVNTGDETMSSIKSKLGISTLSGCNTGDETNSTIKCKLGAASRADDGYLKACDFTNFSNKQSTLVSGENIITINGCTILRCGDICVCNGGGDMKACMYDPYRCCTDMFNRANHYGCMSYACITGLGSAAIRDIGINCGNVVVVQNNGKISSDVLPAQDLVDVCVFNNEADMLAWSTANRGDMAIRADISRTYVMSGSCPSCIDNWIILPVPSSPITSVNGRIGDVCLTTDNIDDSNSTKKYVSASEKVCWCGKADPYVSGLTIKTVNGCSILGSGNIDIPNTIACVNGKTGNVCLTADDIPDTGTGHLFVSQTEKNNWNCKISCADAIVDNCQLLNSCGYVTSVDANTKTFYLSSTSDLTNAQAAYNWYVAGKNPIIIYNNSSYTLFGADTAVLYFRSTLIGLSVLEKKHHDIAFRYITLSITNGSVSSIALKTIQNHFLSTSTNYACPYMPLYNGSPTTKKYVDNCITCVRCDIPSIAGLVQECNIATINGCCLTCGGCVCIEAGGFGWIDHIPEGQSCILCEGKQLIVEGSFTIDGELINNGKIYII